MPARPHFQVITLDGTVSRVREYKKRNLHSKTKSGCLTCKAKKVKCDEARPICVKCQRNGRLCAYVKQNFFEQDLASPIPSVELHQSESFSTLSSVTLAPFLQPSAPNGTSSINLVQHFHRHWDEIFTIPGKHELMMLSGSDPLVRSIVLAITACHLRHVCPDVLQHRIAEHFQQALALQQYQKTLNMSLERLGQAGVNSLLLSASLLNVLAFVLPQSETHSIGEPDPTSSWVFSTSDDRLGWLKLQMGIRTLVQSTATYLAEAVSFLSPVLLGLKRESWEFGGTGVSMDTIPETWITVFGLSGSGTDFDGTTAHPCHGHVFRPPAMILAGLRHLEPISVNVFRNLQFLGKIQREFQGLLYNRDERALWLFGYWLGLLCRYEGIWWCAQRVRRDYAAIHIWLQHLRLAERPGKEGLLWAAMMRDFELAPRSDA